MKPLEHELGVEKDNGGDTDEEDVAHDEKSQELAAKYDEFKAQVEQHFGMEDQREKRDVPIVKALT